MTNKTSGFQTKLYNNNDYLNSDNLQSLQLQSSPMQYVQYSSVALTPSTMSSPSPPLNGNFSPDYIEKADYNSVLTSLNSPIKQELHNFTNSNTSISRHISSNMVNYHLNQQNHEFVQQQLNPQNQTKSNKRSADDNQPNNNVKRGRSRNVEPNVNSVQQSNQTKKQNSQSSVVSSQANQSKVGINEQSITATTVKPVRTRRTRAKSPTLVQKLKKNRRLKANDRERNRMHTLNKALERLREKLPVSGTSSIVANNNEETMSNCSNKLTKIETLRFSVTYIQALQNILQKLDYSELNPSISPESMLNEAAMSAAAAVASLNSSQNLLLNNSQNRYSSSFSSLFNTNSMNSGILSTTSSMSNDDDEDDLLMLMNQECNQEEDIFEHQTNCSIDQQVYHLN